MGDTSAVRPLLHKLIRKHLVDAPSDSSLKRSLERAAFTDLQSQYTDPSVADLLDKACFLDLCFRALSILPEPERKRVVAAIEEEAKDIVPTVDSTEQEPPLKQRKQSGLMSLLEDVSSCTSGSVDDPPQQVASYQRDPEVPVYQCRS